MTTKNMTPEEFCAHLAPGVPLPSKRAVTERDIERALAVAEIPKAEFEAAVERDEPATIDELVTMGMAARATAIAAVVGYWVKRGRRWWYVALAHLTEDERAALLHELEHNAAGIQCTAARVLRKHERQARRAEANRPDDKNRILADAFEGEVSSVCFHRPAGYLVNGVSIAAQIIALRFGGTGSGTRV
jgi:hypothetical protein